MKERPNWDDYFFEFAEVASHRASCPRASIGAVLVKNNRIVATGYNGAPANTTQCNEDGCIVVDDHCQRALHAEVNCIGYAARSGVSVQGCTLYLYGRPPCRECNKVLIACGIYTVKVKEPDV